MNKTQKRLSWVLVLLSAAVPVLAYFWPQEHAPTGWILTTLIVTVFVLVAGKYCTNLWRGVLIDKRNLISLSRFQMVVWTLVILPGWFSIVFHNLAAGDADTALDVAIPEQVFILLGISTVAMLGSPLIKGEKLEKPPAGGTPDAALTPNPTLPPGKSLLGRAVVNQNPSDASWGDILKGETTGDFDTLDLAKVQMFLFTLLLALAYAFSFAKLFANAGDLTIDSLPPISEGMNMMLGISNAAYLTHKTFAK